jgi:hypothetical protein
LCHRLSYASGGWHSRLSTSRRFIREIVVKKIVATLRDSFPMAVQRSSAEEREVYSSAALFTAIGRNRAEPPGFLKPRMGANRAVGMEIAASPTP